MIKPIIELSQKLKSILPFQKKNEPITSEEYAIVEIDVKNGGTLPGILFLLPPFEKVLVVISEDGRFEIINVPSQLLLNDEEWNNILHTKINQILELL